MLIILKWQKCRFSEMASLKETKDRISTVRNTLKTTSAMKLVASAKLRKVMALAGNMRMYEERLHAILGSLLASLPESMQGDGTDSGTSGASAPGGTGMSLAQARPLHKVAVVAYSSNSSLCGAFNSNIIKTTTQVIQSFREAGLSDADITVYSVGRKMADAMRKLGFRSPADYSGFSEKLSYSETSVLAQELLDAFVAGRFDKVVLVYNHNKSSASQVPTVSTLLPLSLSGESQGGVEETAKGCAPDHGGASSAGTGNSSANASQGVAGGTSGSPAAGSGAFGTAGSGASNGTGSFGSSGTGTSNGSGFSGAAGSVAGASKKDGRQVIVEPSEAELITALLPKVVRLEVFTTLLDATAAEHAARTVAMQMATDNGNELLSDLTLEYNKGRQSKITSEILDIVSGSMQ